MEEEGSWQCRKVRETGESQATHTEEASSAAQHREGGGAREGWDRYPGESGSGQLRNASENSTFKDR